MGGPAGRPSGSVSYKLARQRVIAAYERGARSSEEVCDAQPELRRVAHHHAVALEEDCPICGDGDLVVVSFAFGRGLPRSGRCLAGASDLVRLGARDHPTTVYRIEVCRSCWWNHLRESFELAARSELGEAAP